MTAAALVLVILFGSASWLLTGQARRFALSRGMLDVPNQRSSHSAPVPRGGGLSIVLVTLVGTVLAWLLGWISRDIFLAFMGGAPIALVGWLDDRLHLGARTRAAVHVLAAGWAVWCLGGYDAILVGTTEVVLGAWGSGLAVVAVVWATNLYNFMDGIDGIAAGEAVAAGAVGGAMLLTAGSNGLAWLSLLLAAACAGFLRWNWSPAKIFMGDIGSGFLGYSFAVLALASERTGAAPALLWVLVFGVFVFDATVTLLRRAVRRQRLYVAHRSHAYQRAVRAGMSHAQVSASAIATTAALGGLALWGQASPGLTLPLFAAGAVALTLLYLAVERVHPMSAAAPE